MSNSRKDSQLKTSQLVSIFKALANEHRYKIYQLLVSCCSPGTVCTSQELQQLCVGDLDAQLDIAPSTLSHHLKELQQAGLVNMKRKGKKVFCSVDPDMPQQIVQLFSFNTPTTKP